VVTFLGKPQVLGIKFGSTFTTLKKKGNKRKCRSVMEKDIKIASREELHFL
jgi:hypothetical protein